jgi:hypothetical protein
MRVDGPVAINDRGEIAAFSAPWQGGPYRTLVLTPNEGFSPFFPHTADEDTTLATTRFRQAPTDRWYAPGTPEPQSGGPVGAVAAAPLPNGLRPFGPAQAYHYVADLGLFAQVQDFPYAFKSPVEVSVGGIALGEFMTGHRLTFAEFGEKLGPLLEGGGVREFTVTGIDPMDDVRGIPKFSLELGFTGDKADFRIQARNSMVGDADGDGVVGFADFVTFRAFFGDQGRSWFEGDFTLDGEVAADDFELLRSNMGGPLTPEQAAEVDEFAATVPEPGTAVALLTFCALLLRRRPAGSGDPGNALNAAIKTP